ncbi:MAG: Recombinase [Candidatus Uhrbacteria bacterium GW2011_GWF2_39_13]|uniref:Recombinase n=1 Tax=Candidatus Uhrbacteria bacterium GW2011_GWF2_39_13 TaxID=1618995 RepID=A0A0G0MIW0_9BACT|nr:MAG: Recombinase [Candidatus Uhrbacteria bacterium GW2011_GWF2_39_13]
MVSDKREKFRSMLDSLKDGSYDGIITWAPDRLARNMKEGGEIIDMLDRGEIEDIKFASGYTFTNDSSGKMLLGIAFVMTKQYSDQHSQNVRRAIRRKTGEGKWAGSHLKQGYYKDRQHFLRPDGKNHDLIKTTFEMRLDGKELKVIAKFLCEEGFPVTTRHTKHKEMVVNDKFVSDLLRDPIYAGAMIFGDEVVNLFEKYDFVPAVDTTDMERLLTKDGVRKSYNITDIVKPRGSIKADLMRGMVVCSHCNRSMSSGITPKTTKEGTKRYFYFRCDTQGCQRKGKSVRAKVVMEAAYAFLNKHPLTSKKGYTHYKTQMAKVFETQQQQAVQDIKSLKAQRSHAQRRVSDMKELIRDAKGDKVLVKEYESDMKKHLAKVKDIDKELKKLEVTRTDAHGALVNFEEFHELFQNIAVHIQNIDAMNDLDFIMRKLFINFTITDGKVTEITQNSPFRELCLDTDSVMVTPRGIEPRFTG